MTDSIPGSPAEVVALTRRLNAWLDRIGAPQSEKRAELVVGLVDSLSASRQVADALSRLLAADPSTPAGAEDAMVEVGTMYAWLEGEMKPHLEELLAAWEPILEHPLAERLPPDLENGAT
jgi:hypothetical protein